VVFFAVIMIVQIARRAVQVALDRPPRELLYIGRPRVDRLASKGFIDPFVYRAGDAVAAGACGLVSGAGVVAAALPIGGIALSLGWARLGIRMGGRR